MCVIEIVDYVIACALRRGVALVGDFLIVSNSALGLLYGHGILPIYENLLL